MRNFISSVACVLFLAVLLVIPPESSSINGCLWDRDTLRAEAQGLPGVVEVIVGRFDRYPDLYYEMRLARVTGEVAVSPDDLGLYDDAGVACDRLGRSDEAIGWMGRKLAAMERLETAGEDTAEHRYRYLANLGTFHIHRWLKGGADRSAMDDVRLARDLIAQAIELNPDAHFGREPVQLLAIEWILNPPQREQGRYDSYGRWSSLRLAAMIESDDYDLVEDFEIGEAVHTLQTTAGVEGLSGLITLGAAWQSVDIYGALADSLRASRNQTMAYVGGLRVRELLDAGKWSLHPLAAHPSEIDTSEFGSDSLRTGGLDRFYRRARDEADQWHAARTAYLVSRLELGRHPDTESGFWDAWVEPSQMPALPNGFLGLGYVPRSDHLLIATAVGAIALLVVARILKARGKGLKSAAPGS